MRLNVIEEVVALVRIPEVKVLQAWESEIPPCPSVAFSHEARIVVVPLTLSVHSLPQIPSFIKGQGGGTGREGEPGMVVTGAIGGTTIQSGGRGKMREAGPPKLTHFKALVFDVYGTLCDWEEGIYQALLPILTRANSRLNRKEALVAFSVVEERLQKAYPQMLYAELLTKAHEEISQMLATTTPSLIFSQEDHIAFGQSIKDWPIFPDSTDALAYLSTQYKLVVLSNVDRKSFSFTQAKLEAGKFSFDQVCTAQDIGSYKPDPKNFEYALRVIKENYGIEKDQVLSTAQSLHHDHVPAQALGMSSAWINRDGASIGFDNKPIYNFKFKTLGEMAEAVRKELE